MTIDEQIGALVRDTGETDARAAVRVRAQELIAEYREHFGEPVMPMNIEALASLRGVRKTDEPPTHSRDAELVPQSDGSVHMRVNADRPETRQRFSMGHEVTHTFFPEYQAKVQCRPDHRFRDPENEADVLEMLCDIGAAELLFPLPWFAVDALAVGGASGLVQLADDYRASREATLRRFAETSDRCLATVFFAWKLKPIQQPTIGCKDQMNIFGTDPEVEARGSWKLRIEYAIVSPTFAEAGHYLPKDKSVETDGPFGEATRGACADGECHLDLGGMRGRCRVWAIPLYTPSEVRGPAGELVVAAVLEPLEVKKSKKKTHPSNPGLFD